VRAVGGFILRPDDHGPVSPTRDSIHEDGEDPGSALPGWYRTLATLAGVAAGGWTTLALDRDPLGEAVVAVVVVVGVALAVVALGALLLLASRKLSSR
jgi:hypothetical protein